MNRCIFIGRLTRDPELRTTGSGTNVATFTIAVDRQFKNANGERETDFINIVVWRGLADTCSRYLHKGDMASVDGRLQIRTYEAQDGSKRTAAEIVAEYVQFLTPKGNTKASGSSADLSNNSAEIQEAVPLDDIPF